MLNRPPVVVTHHSDTVRPCSWLRVHRSLRQRLLRSIDKIVATWRHRMASGAMLCKHTAKVSMDRIVLNSPPPDHRCMLARRLQLKPWYFLLVRVLDFREVHKAAKHAKPMISSDIDTGRSFVNVDAEIGALRPGDLDALHAPKSSFLDHPIRKCHESDKTPPESHRTAVNRTSEGCA